MEDFLRDNYTLLTKTVEIIAAISGVFVYSKFKSTNVKFFIWILIGIAILELIGGYTIYIERYIFLEPLRNKIKGTKIETNHWMYTLFWKIGATIAFVYYFLLWIKGPIFKNILKILTAGFIIVSAVVIGSNFSIFFNTSFRSIGITSSLLIMIAVVFYLIQILQSERILQFYKSINFIIAATLLIWYLITTPLIFYDIYFSRDDMPYVVLKSSILLFSNIFMYITFSIALLWCKPENN
ncbi:MAG: hypothetical protein KJN68_11345 [Bacteroidia bacterium]|nr:hypothetical protein [Bacteroidia bacterium]